jgi:hypothetical protein
MTDAPRLPRVGRLLVRLVATVLVLAALALASLYAVAGVYGFNVLFRRGVWIGVTVAPDDPRLSASIRLALRDPSVAAAPGPLEWRSIAPGFEVAELAVIAQGAEVDRIALARVDPARFRFVVRSAPAGNRGLDAWMRALGAVLVVNGSYFSRDGTPDTPIVSAGQPLGPRHYIANHGAFADDAMVSFPLLVARDGSSRVKADPRWLANRSFVGEDHAGRIIVGTTADAFFSLERLGNFLRDAPLDLAVALNLDGGPIACQGIALDGFRRDQCGRWELVTRDDRPKLLTPVFGTVRWGLPIVLAALPR